MRVNLRGWVECPGRLRAGRGLRGPCRGWGNRLGLGKKRQLVSGILVIRVNGYDASKTIFALLGG